MAEIVNLRLARKRKAREDREKQAETNRQLHGQPVALRKARRAEDERATRALDAHRRSDGTSPFGSDASREKPAETPDDA